VVHTLGTLFEDADGAYKRAIRSGDVPGLLRSFWGNIVVGGSGGNPLEKHQQLGEQAKRGTYEVINRDSGKPSFLLHCNFGVPFHPAVFHFLSQGADLRVADDLITVLSFRTLSGLDWYILACDPRIDDLDSTALVQRCKSAGHSSPQSLLHIQLSIFRAHLYTSLQRTFFVLSFRRAISKQNGKLKGVLKR